MHREEDPSSDLFRRRHSLAHILAQAMQRYRPGTLLGFGPPVEDGFYYDFILPEPISDEDLSEIEKLMRAIIAEKQEFVHESLAADEAVARLRQMDEPHKVEYALELIARDGLETLDFYTNGTFVDMCEGPHVENTQEIRHDCFKLHSVAGAYWRGDERREQMTRVYGWAFANKKELKAYEQARLEALKRDHRKLGQELDIFTIDEDVGKGLPLWLPNGAVICHELEKLAQEFEFQDGYLPVRTPNITKGKLYEISGHLELYKHDMYPPMMLEDEGQDTAYYLRPMNCPHHHKVFSSRPRSYRDLPLRLSEYGSVYRYERSGTLQGLTRVRGMTMNDAHIYITEDQIRDEFMRVMRLHLRYYDLFGLSDYYMRLSLWDPSDPKGREKYVHNPAAWEFSQARVREAMKEVGIPCVEAIGEAAFYGPKIDIQFRTVGMKEFTVSTNQLDFAVAPRFGLVYKDRDGEEKTPYIIHRAPLSTHERFVSFLIEHFGGAFPTWLAPLQVRVLPLSETFLEYAHKVVEELRRFFVRAEVDTHDDKLGKKIRNGTTRKIPILLVVGEQERTDETVTVRRYGIREQRALKIREMVDQVLREIRARKHVRSWEDIEELIG